MRDSKSNHLNHLSQEEVIAREDAKIQRKRDQNEQRRLRILNAKARIMGLDVQGLDQQVVEKQQQRQREKEADIFASKWWL